MAIQWMKWRSSSIGYFVHKYTENHQVCMLFCLELIKYTENKPIMNVIPPHMSVTLDTGGQIAGVSQRAELNKT